ncbi:class I SAM-dependent methyltransferase [Biformimicrobium ophioploci]|uniref:Methyltransferase domain-containing protein n=1 Tax=Biformimicrobium ophioploci TaxID=3036711 RepID=A0ABQ6M2Y0_9GAMM|nr:class I SAM-dependent methyltransferase [Microbulbifer sp. NKW57]GMG88688.1 methyltransferase domain-containing protein [Microbulbifer sp. NKW57]
MGKIRRRAARWWSQQSSVPPLSESYGEIRNWFSSNLGNELLSQELAVAQPLIEQFFGYHLLQASVAPDVDLAASSRINHRFRLSPVAEASGEAVADLNHLPLPEGSVDVVVLHHLLDFAEDPHQLLREAARVLIPNGHLVLIGFSPYSLMGIYRAVGRVFSSRPHFRGNSLSLSRVTDWMKFLDLQPGNIEKGFFRWPVQHGEILAQTSWMERQAARWRLPWGGFYLIVARKEVVRMQAIKPNWQRKHTPALGMVPSSSRVTEAARNKPRD